MNRKMIMLISALLIVSAGGVNRAGAQDGDANTCPSDHPIQYKLPTDAADPADPRHNTEIGGGDYHIESVSPETVQLCGEPWPIAPKDPPAAKPCSPGERRIIIDSNRKHGIEVPHGIVRVAGYAPSPDKQTVMVLMCSDSNTQIARHVRQMLDNKAERDRYRHIIAGLMSFIMIAGIALAVLRHKDAHSGSNQPPDDSVWGPSS